MTQTAIPGPSLEYGQLPILLGPVGYTGAQPAIIDSNPDLAPRLTHGGYGVPDPRYQPLLGGGAMIAGGYPRQACGWYMGRGGLIVCDQVPATASTTNIAAAAHVVNGAPMVLAGASTGITVLAAPLALPFPLGVTIPAGCLVLDGNPGYLGGGISGAFQFLDPTKGLCRGIAITAVGGAAGGNFLVRGYDWYGQAMSQTIVSVTASTVNSLKAFKFILSITPLFTDANNYSVGTADVFGLNVRADRYTYVNWAWDTGEITTGTGFVAAVTTSPATSLTGDPRGTLAPASASDGAKRLFAAVGLSVGNVVQSGAAAFADYTIGVCGVQQA